VDRHLSHGGPGGQIGVRDSLREAPDMTTTTDLDSEYLRSGEIWSCLVAHMEADRWYRLSELYDLVQTRLTIRAADLEPEAPGSRSPRWRRNVRNVLQGRKQAGEIDGDHKGSYRLPR
jgi:hypothetical protein